MINFNRPNFSFISISSRKIFHNGKSLGFNTLYTNINGFERKFASLNINNNNNSFYTERSSDNFSISDYTKKAQIGFQELDKIHQKKMERTRSQFFDIKKLVEEQNNDEMDEKIYQKEKELEELEQEGDDMEFSSTTNLYDTFMETESRKITEEFNSKKKKIDEKYRFNKPKLELDESQKEKINNYKKEIKSLNRYSSNSKYKKVINDFSLNDYV